MNFKHTNFELSIKEQLEDFELPYNPSEWDNFEQKLNNEVKIKNKTSQKINTFFKNNFKNILLILSLITNILIVIFLFYYLEKTKNNQIKDTISPQKIIYQNNNKQDTNRYILLENKINYLQNDIQNLHKIYENKTIIVQDTIKNISEIFYADTIFKIDTITLNNHNTTSNESDTITNEQNTVGTELEFPKTEFYLWKDLSQPPMFKDKRGKYHFIADLEEYISSEFQPSNLKKNYNDEITCLFTFFIDKKGQVSNIQPIKTVNPDIEKEVIRIVKGMPEWKAGQNEKGDTIVTKINLRFNIILKKSNPFPNF